MNKVLVIGRITHDLELKSGQKNYCQFQVATLEQHTQFLNCVIFDNEKSKGASNLVKFCKKGSLISIDGRTTSSESNGKKYQQINAISIGYLINKDGSGNNNQNQQQNNTNYGNNNQNVANPNGYPQGFEDVGQGNYFENSNNQNHNIVQNDDFFTNNNVDISDDDLPF